MAKKSATTELNLKESIQQAWIDAVLTDEKKPASVYAFARRMGITEADFYTHYTSLETIDLDIWKTMLNETITRLADSPEYAQFPVREKVLTFFFTLVEVLKNNRSYVAWSTKGWMNPAAKLPAQKAATEWVEPYFAERVAEGLEAGELKDRKRLTDLYKKGLMLQYWFVVDFWLKDQSNQFEDTDAAIEKAVNLGFDLMQQSSLDKAIDFAGFLWGRR